MKLLGYLEGAWNVYKCGIFKLPGAYQRANPVVINTNMNLSRKIAILGALLLVVSASAQDTFSLRRVPVVGEILNFKMEAKLSLQDKPLVIKSNSSEKVLKLGEDKSYTVESAQSELKVTYDGKELPSGDTDSEKPRQVAYSELGMPIEITGSAEDSSTKGYRLENMMSFIAPAKAVKVGDKWTAVYKSNAKTGTLAAAGNYELLGAETVAGTDCLKVKVEYKEVSGDKPATGAATFWLSKKDFTLVKLEAKLTNTPLPMMEEPTSLSITLERVF